MKQESKKIIALQMAWPYWHVTKQLVSLYPILGDAFTVATQYNTCCCSAASDNALPYGGCLLHKRQAVIIDMMAVQTTQCCK